jgi:hypothetical protein
MIGTITWLNVAEGLPKQYLAVIVRTTYSKYPACIGFHNGLSWIDVDLKTEILNVEYYAYINLPHEESNA